MSLGPVARVLGDGNAENERDLVRAFLRTHDYDEVAANSRFLVLGGRGAGKSAIFRMLSLDSAAAQGSIWSVDLSFDDLSTQKIERASRSEGADVSAIARQWELGILIQCFDLIRENAPDSIRRRKLLRDVDKRIAEVRQDSRKLSVGRLGAVVETAAEFLRRLPFKFVVKAPFLPVSIETRDAQPSAEAPDRDEDRVAWIESMYGVIREGLPEGTRLRVLIDELDVGWKATPAQMNSLVGLLFAFNQIRKTLIKLDLDERLSVVLFLRADIYETLKRNGLDDASKYQGYELHLRWTPPALRAMLDHRLSAAATGAPLTMRDLFTDERLSGKSLDEFLLGWITPRPRDLIMVLSQCVESAKRRAADRIGKQDVESAMTFYSAWRFSVIREESRYAIFGVEAALDSFKNGMPQYSPREMNKHLDEAKRNIPDAPRNMTKLNLLELFIETGFLGVQLAGQRTVTFTWDLPPGHSLSATEKPDGSQDLWVIHPALWRALAINPPRGRAVPKARSQEALKG